MRYDKSFSAGSPRFNLAIRNLSARRLSNFLIISTKDPGLTVDESEEPCYNYSVEVDFFASQAVQRPGGTPARRFLRKQLFPGLLCPRVLSAQTI